MNKKIYYASNGNLEKFNEVKNLLKGLLPDSVELENYPNKLEMIQNRDIREIAKSKAMDAYKKLCRPVFVEQTALRLPKYGGSPDGQTSIYWEHLGAAASKKIKDMPQLQKALDMLKDDMKKQSDAAEKKKVEEAWYRLFNKDAAEKFAELHQGEQALAVSVIAYCDGKKVWLSEEKSTSGVILSEIQGDTLFEWDCIFSPDGSGGKSLAELKKEIDPDNLALTMKDRYMPRKDVLAQLAEHLKSGDEILPDVIPAGQQEAVARLKEGIAQKNVILFAGSGLSYNFDLPSWETLIQYLAPKQFQLTKAAADTNGADSDGAKQIFMNLEVGHIPSLAEYCAIEDKEFHKKAQKWMSENWGLPLMEKNFEKKVSKADPNIRCRDIYSALYQLKFPYIYTTNYDHCLEFAFNKLQTEEIAGGADEKTLPPYQSVRSLKDIQKLSQKYAIYKFHGDMSDKENPERIILTESDYFRRMALEDPMDLRLRSDLMNYSFLFLGYSLADQNLRYLLYRLAELRRLCCPGCEKNSYLFMISPNPAEIRILEETFGVKVIIAESADPAKATMDFLRSLK